VFYLTYTITHGNTKFKKKDVWLILWIGEISAHYKKDLPDRTALSGQRLGLRRAAQFKGRRNECFKGIKKIYFLYSTNVKLMSQSERKFNKYCDVINFKVKNFG
jgi:hypothetical protein